MLAASGVESWLASKCPHPPPRKWQLTLCCLMRSYHLQHPDKSKTQGECLSCLIIMQAQFRCSFNLCAIFSNKHIFIPYLRICGYIDICGAMYMFNCRGNGLFPIFAVMYSDTPVSSGLKHISVPCWETNS